MGLIVEARPLQAHFRIPHTSLLLDTYPFPPKTTAVGMLAGVMGYPPDSYFRLLREVNYGVIIEDQGERIEEISAIYKNPHSPLYPITKVSLYKPHFRMFFTGPEEFIERAYEALLDPKFVPYLGDSESLFYPASPGYVKLVEVKHGKEKTLRSILPANVEVESVDVFRKRILAPKEYEVPVAFVYRGKHRRAVYRRFLAFSGVVIRLKEPIDVMLFDGEPVFTF
ncbi:CRISPR-associated protein Cas5 [Pyrococcus sp. ST04]|nr:CRISPR-associated protein Cas5 [Pyrococcus sp. ST04]